MLISLRVLRGPLAAASVAHHEAAQDELHDLHQARAALPHQSPLEYRDVAPRGHHDAHRACSDRA
jgi:hypothetical protein